MVIDMSGKILYYEMKAVNHPSLSITIRNSFVAKSSLLEDVKKGKKPEKTHVPLDYFFKKF